uniref:Uncharacterized protein n=1 Tax=Oryza brachyantha TaxID=4533 RepID=J3LHH8_ORYBR
MQPQREHKSDKKCNFNNGDSNMMIYFGFLGPFFLTSPGLFRYSSMWSFLAFIILASKKRRCTNNMRDIKSVVSAIPGR